MKGTVYVITILGLPGIVVKMQHGPVQVEIGAEMTQGYMVYRSFVRWDFR
jgi:hypothetical protein